MGTKKISDPRLKAFVDSTKNDSVLLGAVDRHIQLLPNNRDSTVIHPSEMAQPDWCPRATYLRLIGYKPAAVPPLVLRSALIFDTGHAIHDKWQTWVKDMGILWGLWNCTICNTLLFEWSNNLGGTCPETLNGRPHQWKYREVPLQSPGYRIAGHADGVIDPSFDEPILLEVKSIGPGTLRSLDLLAEDESDELAPSRFSRITRPYATHIRQVQIYLRLLENRSEVLGPVNRAVVIYENKADQQVREFVVTRNDKWTDPLFETALDIRWAIDNGREVVCPKGGCAYCKPFEKGNP